MLSESQLEGFNSSKFLSNSPSKEEDVLGENKRKIEGGFCTAAKKLKMDQETSGEFEILL